MSQRVFETKFYNIIRKLYEEFTFDGRTEYNDYDIGLIGHDMEKMVEMLRSSGVFKRINKTGWSKVSIEIDPEELEDWIKNN